MSGKDEQKEADIKLVKKWAVARFRQLLASAGVNEQIELFVGGTLEQFPLNVQINMNEELMKKLKAGTLAQFEQEKI